MKIVHLVTTLDVGGAEMHLLAQVRGQAARGHAPVVAYLKGHGTLAPDFTAAGAREVLHVRGVAGLRALARLVRGADVVHTHLLKADMFGAAFATLLGRRARLVASKHNDEQVLKRPLVSFVHGLLGRLPRTTIVLSDHVGRFIEEHGRVPRTRIERIYYGLDPQPFVRAAEQSPAERQQVRAALGAAPGSCVFVCVARFAPQKAHDVLLRGFAGLLAGGVDARLWLVGDDPFGDGRVRAEALARELDLGARVSFLGIRRDVPNLVAAADVFTMTSLWEGLGLVFLEAMAAARPILATQVSAVPEVVADGRTGLLVPPRDAAAWSDAAARLAADPALRARFGEEGRAVCIARFGLERMIDETLAVYSRLPGLQPTQGPALP
jgi:glycosyltransferase involved in cell wall biosynthesis